MGRFRLQVNAMNGMLSIVGMQLTASNYVKEGKNNSRCMEYNYLQNHHCHECKD